MTTLASEQLREISLPVGAVLEAQPECLRLRAVLHGVELVLTVPKEVLEWFVDVTHVESGRRIQDWCDYYGNDSRHQLDQAMARDVVEFANRALTKPIRFETNSIGPDRLLWNIDGAWKQAVPFA